MNIVQTLSGQSGSFEGTLVGVTADADGSGISAWFIWMPVFPGAAEFIFDTRGSATEFKTRLSVYYPAVSSSPQLFTDLTEDVYIPRTDFRNGYGYEIGSLIGFAAYTRTYYIRVQSRDGSVGRFSLRWKPYIAAMLGGCGHTSIDMHRIQGARCVGTVTYSQITGTPALQAFGTFDKPAGKYRIERCDPRITYNSWLFVVCGTAYDLVSAGFKAVWSSATAYSRDDVVSLQNGSAYWWLLRARNDIPAGTPIYPESGGYDSTLWEELQDYQFIFWNSACQMVEVFSTVGGVVGPFQGGGIAMCGGADMPVVPNSVATATFRLIWLPLVMEIFTGSYFDIANAGLITGTFIPGSWNISFNIANKSAITWENVSFELLAGGGFSDVANAVTHGSGTAVNLVTLLAPGVAYFVSGVGTLYGTSPTNTGWWMGVTADPTAGFATVTVRVRYNDLLVGDLVFPIYPAVTLAMRLTFVRSGTGYWWQDATLDLTTTAFGDWPSFGNLSPSALYGSRAQVVVTLTRADGLTFRNVTGTLVTSLTGTSATNAGTIKFADWMNFQVPAIATAQDVVFNAAVQLQVADSVFLNLPGYSFTVHTPALPA